MAFNSMDIGAGGSHRQGGVFKYDHGHDSTPELDEEEDEGQSGAEEDDEDVREVDYGWPVPRRL